jgi:signal transduction histidine kinase
VSDVLSTERWERWLTRLPFLVLVVATLIAMAAGPAIGAASPPARLVAQLALVGLTAAWMWWFTVARPELAHDEGTGRLYYVVRTALALVLTLLNPLFSIFAWVGYIDAHEYFAGRARWVAIAVTAFVMATGQSGGLPVALDGQAILLVALFAVNLALAGVMSSYGQSIYESNDRRARAITELEAVNADLQQALAENARLHETVVEQALAGVVAQLQAAHADPDPERLRSRVDRATALARDALAEARRSVMDLAPAQLSGGSLADAVQLLVSSWAAESEVKADVVVAGDARTLHPEVEATLLRITQETLANVGKHAAATRVGVTLTYDDDEVILDVRDDGVGFDPTAPERPTSFGLRGMRQRADRLAGALDVETAPGAGTAVSVRLPALERSAA